MTLDRDIRVTPFQIVVASSALRDEVKKRTRSIDKAEAQRAAGVKIQARVLEEHYEARAAARELLEALEVARKQVAHRIAEKIAAGRAERGDAS